MRGESEQFTDALKAVTTRTPLIARGVINASKSSHSLASRQGQLAFAINNARALLDYLLERRAELGWPDESGAT